MSDNEKSIKYYHSPGVENTPDCIMRAVARARELGITTYVVASSSGKTAEMLYEAIDPNKESIVAVSYMVGLRERGVDQMGEAMRTKLAQKGIKVLTTSHALSGVGKGITNKFGYLSPQELMANTLKLMGQGTKVALEISVMASDAGLIPMDQEVMALGGSKKGADTACVVTPAHSNEVFNFKFHEIVCKPRL